MRASLNAALVTLGNYVHCYQVITSAEVTERVEEGYMQVEKGLCAVLST